MSDSDAGAIRERAEALLAKARDDDTFAHALRSDPETVLRAEGFEGESLETLATEIHSDGGEVAGHQMCKNYTCILTTCFFSKLTGG